MEKRYLIIVLLLMSLGVHGQPVILDGTVTESGSGTTLIGANVRDMGSDKGTMTDEDGSFSLQVSGEEGLLVISYVGYQADTVFWSSSQDTMFHIELVSSVYLGEVTIQSGRAGRIEDESQASMHRISMEQIEKLPGLLGETDVLKSLQLMPGVQSGTEGTSGIFVRGGSIDQNLILVDGVAMYNPSHVLGLFSSFNSDAIQSVRMTKGGFPARYGGRLSSVVEVDMRAGDTNDFHGSGQIGLISSKLLLEGPIVRGKSSFLFSVRRSYTDLIARPVIRMTRSEDKEQVLPTAYFHDASIKLTHRFSDTDLLTVTGYMGADNYGVKRSDDTETTDAFVTWGNYLGTLNWKHRINPKLFTNASVTYSRYRLDNDVAYSFFKNGKEDYFNSIYYSGISDIGLNYSFDFMPNRHHSLKMGMKWTHHIYSPGALTYGYELDGENIREDYQQGEMTSQERAFFLEDDLEYGNFKINAGFHFSQFYTDEKLYYSFQPRLSIRYLLPGRWAVKASYAQMQQYINLLTSESLSLPSDLWIPSTDRIEPQTSWQWVVGVAKTLWKDYEFTLEGYYKEMNNVLSYQPGVSFILDVASSHDWQSSIAQGRGWAYGAEFLFKKKYGRTSGWVGYTLSWNYRQFDEINQGEKFPFTYDRRHDLSLVLSHELSDRWSVSGVWIYGTGNAYSVPDRYFPAPEGLPTEMGGYAVYSQKNNYRMSDYHRLDVSFTRTGQKKWGSTTWEFGAYNTYFRKNPFYVSQDQNGTVKEVSILPIIPYISWGFKF